MNSWLRLALYSFIGVLIGSFALGLLAPRYGTGMTGNMNMSYPSGQMQPMSGSNGMIMDPYNGNMMMPPGSMNSGMNMGGQSQMNMGGQSSGGMGMMGGMMGGMM